MPVRGTCPKSGEPYPARKPSFQQQSSHWFPPSKTKRPPRWDRMPVMASTVVVWSPPSVDVADDQREKAGRGKRAANQHLRTPFHGNLQPPISKISVAQHTNQSCQAEISILPVSGYRVSWEHAAYSGCRYHLSWTRTLASILADPKPLPLVLI